MADLELNRFTEELAALGQRLVLEEKWLIAPSLRVGHQHLVRLARAGHPVMNVRIKTLRGLALELAAPEMESQGLRFLGAMESEVITGGVFAQLKQARQSDDSGYLTRLPLNEGLTQSLSRTIRDLRLAGVAADRLQLKNFEDSEKGREIKELLVRYERAMREAGRIDYAGALRLAMARLRDRGLPSEAVVIMGRDQFDRLRGLERDLGRTLADRALVLLDADDPEAPGSDELTDRARLGFIRNPAAAPPPVSDHTARLFRAVGEVNEVREVLRRVLEQKIPFDQIEILHPDFSTYVPLLYEQGWLLAGPDDETPPLTFGEGIPGRYSRPVRALMAFLEWRREFDQPVLCRMIQDGLLKMSDDEEEAPPFRTLAEALRSVPIGEGADRYLPLIDQAIRHLEKKVNRPGRDREGEDREAPSPSTISALQALQTLRPVIADLLELARPDLGQAELLEAAQGFLEGRARAVNQLDQYSLHQLQRSIRQLQDCCAQGVIEGLDAASWLSNQCLESQVGGLGPRPGAVYVSSLAAGGHSGRPHTFILGLDDGRFPAGARQDPLLLDQEREKISAPNLGTAAARIDRSGEDFARLLARLRGDVTLSYSCWSVADDREMFPSPALISAYRILTGADRATLEDITSFTSPPASFAPEDAARALTDDEWWLARVTGDERPDRTAEVLARHFPHLGQGRIAREARQSSLFTEYDGHVPEAAATADPTRPDGPKMSASRLQVLAKNPYEYFLQYVLKIEPPEEFTIDPNQWLDAAEKGALLHELFRCFMSELTGRGETPSFDRHRGLLEKMLDELIRQEREKKPPPNEPAFEREVEDLRLCAVIFLKREQEHCRTRRPRYFEAAIGMSPEADPTPLDMPEPAPVNIGDGRSIRVRGRIDRIDEIAESEGKHFEVWDYKTGSAYAYRKAKPFHEGRVIQNYLYLALVEDRLRQVHPGALIRNFGYFFPNAREHGERIDWPREELLEGREILADLCEMLANGVFPFTTDPDDLAFTNYGAAYLDPAELVQGSAAKFDDPRNTALEPFRRLRGGSGSEGQDE